MSGPLEHTLADQNFRVFYKRATPGVHFEQKNLSYQPENELGNHFHPHLKFGKFVKGFLDMWYLFCRIVYVINLFICNVNILIIKIIAITILRS